MLSRVYVEITNECNLRCSFCRGHARAPRRMTQQEFSFVLERLSGRARYLYYHLMGEPLSHPDLPLFLRMAAEHGFLSVLTTNGTLLSARGETLLAAPLHKVSVSLHSLEDRPTSLRRGYLEEVAAFAEAAAARGVITVFRLWNLGCDGGLNEEVLSFLRGRLDGDWAKNTRGFRIRDKIHVEYGERFAWPDMSAPDGGATVFCHALSDHVGVLSDGSVVPCCLDGDGFLTLGNIFESSLEEILASSRAKAMKEGFASRCASEPLCRRCGYARRFL